MKIPMMPPDIWRIVNKDNLDIILKNQQPVDYKGRYLHWDKLRHLPPPDGLTVEEYWAATKFARNALSKELPFKSKDGTPFMFCVTDTLSMDLHNIDINYGGNLSQFGIRIDEKTKEESLIRSLFKESIASSQLEGASTTVDAAKKMLKEGRTPKDKSEQMIFNNYNAMLFIRENKDERITPSMVFELHRIVTDKTLEDETRAGRFRQDEDEIVVTDSSDGITAHIPPQVETLPSRLQALCDFLNKGVDSKPFIHPIVKGIVAHFMLAYDHPFVDGNGRTARALFYWTSVNYRYWLMEYLSISSEIIRTRKQYDKAFLYSETDGNDLTYFIIYNVQILSKAFEQFLEKLRNRQEEKSRAEMAVGVLKRDLNHRQVDILRYALKYDAPQFTIAEHRGTHGVSYNTARTDLLELTQMGLLTLKKKGKKLVFIKPRDFNAIIGSFK